MNTPLLLIGNALYPLKKANDGVSSWDRIFGPGRRQIVGELPLLGRAGYNRASRLKKNTPTPDLVNFGEGLISLILESEERARGEIDR